MNNEILKNAVAQVIKENGNEEITGNILQQVLIAMINSLGLGFQFIGEAKPNTNPGTPDARVFYFAQDAGTYSNFDGLVLDGSSVAVFLWSDEWAHIVVNIPTTPGLDARYLRIANLASSTGESTTTAMTQKAVTDALAQMLETITTALGNKVDKEPGKGLSSNDYTTQEKQKLAELPTNTQLQETLNTKADKDTDAVDGNLAKFDGNGNPVDSGISTADIITRQELNADAYRGLAEAVVDTDSEGTRQEFTFRQSGGDGGAFYRRILGKTLVWNQINAYLTTQWQRYNYTSIIVIDANERKITVRPGDLSQNKYCDLNFRNINEGHKFYVKFMASWNTNAVTRILYSENDVIVETISGGDGQVVKKAIISQTSARLFAVSGEMSNSAVDTDVITVRNAIVIDLTLMFGTGKEPSTVDEFEALFPNPYYDNNAGALISNDAVRVETVGFNQWDEVALKNGYLRDDGEVLATSGTRIASVNFTPIIAGAQYFIKIPYSLAGYGIRLGWYDSEKRLIRVIATYNNPITAPEGAAYMRFGTNLQYGSETYRGDICFNLSNPAKNGTYEPYWKRVLQLGLDSFEIKDSQNNISTYNGGLKSTPAGIADEIIGETFINRVVRRPHIAADDTDPNVFTDGVNTDAPLATPVEYTLVNPIAHCIKVDEGGTEQAIQPENAALPSAPLSAIATYTMSIQRMVEKLRSL